MFLHDHRTVTKTEVIFYDITFKTMKLSKKMGVGLEGVGRGCKYDQNTLYKILKQLRKRYVHLNM